MENITASANLDKLIAQGENSGLEFKSVKVSVDKIAKEFVAFSNSQGGILLLGVEDNGDITGVEESNKNYEEWITNIARNNVNPPIDIEIEQIHYHNKLIYKVEIAKGKDKPYQTYKHQFLIRIGSTNRIATQAELMRLFQQSGVFHYDQIAVDRTSIKDLNLNKIDQYFDNYQIDFLQEENHESILINTDILTESGQATIAGLLIFGINPQRYLHNASISFAHFAGSDITEELIDKQVVTGNLDFQIDTMLAIIKNNILNPSIIKGAKTVNTNFIYPDKVFRELLVNACVHRNYAISGSRIRIFMYDDRIEFISPGRLPNSVSIEKIKLGVSYAPNPIIVKFMENLRYIDKLGRGLPMVYRTAKQQNKEVIFQEIGEEFSVTLPF
ncbi:RNA-binding domain-containing protein [Candidatus Marithrix sp. Canyon 246]|uniref:RNA-binding domain-containing protein n=1 Tax=Candidatus Marithrix sp. Canyon 246 TaxID=1827136 RepID=UPI00084A2A5E|nr:RNA-binding domain-containing protein [Candidatus Marithrix sp. Canyon 246]